MNVKVDDKFIDEEFDARLALSSQKEMRKQQRKEREMMETSSLVSNSQIGQVQSGVCVPIQML